MENLRINLDNKTLGMICGAVILAVAMIMFGLTGLRVVLGIALLFFLPQYMLLMSSSLEQDEKLMLSLLLGAGLFSFLVYAADALLKSLSTSTVIVFILLSGIGYMIYRKRAGESR